MDDKPSFWEKAGLRMPGTSIDCPVAWGVLRILLLILVLAMLTLLLLALCAAFVVLDNAISVHGANAQGGLSGGASAAGVLVVAILSAPFVIWRATVAQKTVNVAEQGLITDRINKAVEGLGAEKTIKQVLETPRFKKDKYGKWQYGSDGELVQATRPDGAPLVDRETVERTVANLEVRIGAIYALERIAKDSLRDHIQIMEILCAYIRENAPVAQAPKLPEPPVYDLKEGDKSKEALVAWKQKHRDALASLGHNNGSVRPREDIQIALTVIGRRSVRQRRLESETGLAFAEEMGAFPVWSGKPEHHAAWKADAEAWRQKLNDRSPPTYQLNLRNSNLCGADLSSGEFDHADFSGSILDGAGLRQANLNKAKFAGTRINGVSLQQANLNGSEFSQCRCLDSNLQEARMNCSHMNDVDIGESNIDSADLNFSDVYFSRAYSLSFSNASIQFSRISMSDFIDSDLSQTNFIGSFLRMIRFERTNLSGAKFHGTNIHGSLIGRAKFDTAEFNCRILQTEFFNCEFFLTRFFSSYCFKTNIYASTIVENHRPFLRGVGSFSGSAFQAMDISDLGLNKFDDVFGDPSVELPGGITPNSADWPPHWPVDRSSHRHFKQKWIEWKKENPALIPDWAKIQDDWEHTLKGLER